ncbi:solute carrier family 52, riboflavin transporter, member 3-B-like [Dendronephthya gigantea]|uniref:solute carrier family 52, riboflavin transporter, member 3-B-like n=1 Tax=Dendronephthya gigantea TaxID=151771 RepID=UPI00106DCBC2|nr:solute carrier family 52, riboflavin transporter, member 3-B-like [Dendronephthya gigantea]
MKGLQVKIKQKLCQNCDISWATYLLVVLFGVGSWVAVNGIWVELPVLVQHAPEAWKLPSIFAVVIQIANIGPILHTVFNAFFPGKVRDTIVIYVILVLGIIACALLGFLWQKTGFIAGNEYSVALIGLVFCLAFVDCTSSVTFLPFMAAFRNEYMSALFVGAGLSALLPSLLALAQAIPDGGDPCANYTSSNSSSFDSSTASDDLNFGTNVFFFGVMLMMVVSLGAFGGLNCLSFVKRERIDLQWHFADKTAIPREALAVDSSQEFELHSSNGNGHFTSDDGPQIGCCQRVNQPSQLAFLLVIQVWIHAFSNGVVPSIQPYACIPYGNHIYYLTLIISNVANPLASLLFYWLPTTKILFIGLLSAVYTSLVAYILCVASLSSNPPLVNDNIGAIVIVFINVLSVAIVSYTKVAISTWMQKQGERYLRWAGIALQSGSFFGAVTIFIFVNVLNSFSQC